MTLDNWVNELKAQLIEFGGATLESEVKMADIMLGYVDGQGRIHYHKIEYRAKGFESSLALRELQKT